MNEIPLMKVDNYIITVTPVENKTIPTSSFCGSFDINELYNQGVIKQEERKIYPKPKKIDIEDCIKGKSFEEVYQRLLEKKRGKIQ